MAAVDGAVDGALLSFAAWTLWYEVALWGQWSLWWPARVWLLVTVLLVLGAARREQRVARSEAALTHAERPVPFPPRTVLWVGGTVLLLLVLAASRTALGVLPVSVVGILVLLVGLWRCWRVREDRGAPHPRSTADTSRDPAAPDQVRPGVPQRAHAVAGIICLAQAVLAAVLLKPDADDAFYINRASWVAEHGVPVLRDTMFSPGVLPSAYIGGLPLPSIESLQGALAHVFLVSAPTMSYVLLVPLLAAASGWVTWRLVRAWAPRQWLLVYVVTTLFVLWSAESVVGNYSIGRIWQGKVMAFTIVIPLIWLHLSALITRPHRWHQLMLLAAGTCFVGLTSTAELLGPVIGAAALLAAAILRARALATGAVLLLAAPLVAGLVVTLGPAEIGGTDPVPLPTGAAFAIAFGVTTAMVALALAGVVLGVWLVPDRRVAVLLACGSLAMLSAVLPGVFTLVNAVTGAGPVAWRLMLGTPTWVLVGMLVAVPLTVRRPGAVGGSLVPAPLLRGLLVAAVAAVVLLSGRPLWSSVVGAGLTATPTWKVDQAALSDVRALPRNVPGRGPWLLPPKQMEILSLSTTVHSPVVARAYYLSALQVSPDDLRDRVYLLRLAAGLPQRVGRVRVALRRLQVPVACVPATDRVARRTLRAAVGAQLRPVGGMQCHFGALAPRR